MHPVGQTVHEVIDVDADLASVWRAWTDPAWLTGWMVDRTSGEPTPGGAMRWSWDSLGIELDLEVIELEPPVRLVVRGAPRGRAPQMQSVSLSQRERGTRIELVHTGFADDNERAGSEAGWRVMLRVLAHYLARFAGRSRESLAVLAPVPASIAAIGRLIHEPDARARWLAGNALLTEGDNYSLELAPGVPASGRVLAAAPPFELALSWDEVDGVLILRAIQVAPGAGSPVLAGAQAWSWSPHRPAWRAARPALEDAVARLAHAAGGSGARA